MRKLLTLLVVGAACSGLGLLRADEEKTITIEGDGLCAKCALKEKGVTSCQNAVIVTKDGKKTTYFLEKNDFFGPAHNDLGLCKASKDEPVKVKVTGTLVKKDDKHILTPTKKIEKVEKEEKEEKK